MATKRKRKLTSARMILWDRAAQARFIQAVEQVCNLAGELRLTLIAMQQEREACQAEMASKRSKAASKANETRKNGRNLASDIASKAAQAVKDDPAWLTIGKVATGEDARILEHHSGNLAPVVQGDDSR